MPRGGPCKHSLHLPLFWPQRRIRLPSFGKTTGAQPTYKTALLSLLPCPSSHIIITTKPINHFQVPGEDSTTSISNNSGTDLISETSLRIKMRMSCNGCRVLRKGCSEGCTIRPCLEWIKSPEAQANATVFLAKFYGRAGLLNLLAAGPDNLRPALFRSLLYEVCGRMVNPIYGSVGLLWSGQWEACQAAVEAVLKGDRIVQVSSEAASAAQATPPLRAYDIRHVAKDPDASASADMLRVERAGRTRFKRASYSTSKPKGSGAKRASPNLMQEPEPEPVVVGEHDDHDREPSHEESAGSHDQGHVEDDGMAVEETREESEDTEVEAGSHVSQAEQSTPVPMWQVVAEEDEEIGLELTLGFEPRTWRGRRRRRASTSTA